MFTITHLNAVHNEMDGETDLSVCLRTKGVGPVTAMAQLIALLTKEEPDAHDTTNAADEPGGHSADDGSAEPDRGVVAGRRSRRRGDAGGEADTTDLPGDAGGYAAAPAGGEDVGSGDPKPRRRRGTAAYSSGDEDGDGPAPAGDGGSGPDGGGNGVTSRRRRSTVAADAGASVALGSGGTAAGGADLPDPGDGPLTNADLSKAATMAAEVITPAAVMELLEQFGVTKVNDIADKDRREFLDILKDRVSQAKKAA